MAQVDLDLYEIYEMDPGLDIIGIATIGGKVYIVTQNKIYLLKIKQIIEDE